MCFVGLRKVLSWPGCLSIDDCRPVCLSIDDCRSGALYVTQVLRRNVLPLIVGCLLLGLPSGAALNAAGAALVRTSSESTRRNWVADLMYDGWTDEVVASMDLLPFLLFRCLRATVQAAASCVGLLCVVVSWHGWQPFSESRLAWAGLALVTLLSLVVMLLRDLIICLGIMPVSSFPSGGIVLLGAGFGIWLLVSCAFLYFVLQRRSNAQSRFKGGFILGSLALTQFLALEITLAYSTTDSPLVKYGCVIANLALRGVALEGCDLIARYLPDTNSSFRLIVATGVGTITSTAGAVMVVGTDNFGNAAMSALLTQGFEVLRHNLWLRGSGEVQVCIRFLRRMHRLLLGRARSGDAQSVSKRAVVPEFDAVAVPIPHVSEMSADETEIEFGGKLVVATNDRDLVTIMLVTATSLIAKLRPEGLGRKPLGSLVILSRAAVMILLEIIGFFMLAAFAHKWSPDLERSTDGSVLHRLRYDEVHSGVTCIHVLLAMNCILLTYSQFCPTPVGDNGGPLLSLGTCLQ